MALLFTAGCNGAERVETEVLSRIGTRVLTLEEALANVPAAELSADSARSVQNYADAWERRVLLSLEAERIGLTDSPDIRRQIEVARDQVLSDALLRYYQAQLDTVRLTSSDWESFFSSNPLLMKVSEPSAQVLHFHHKSRDSIFALHDAMSRRNGREAALQKFQNDNPEWANEQRMPRSVSQLDGQFPMLRSFWRSTQSGRLSDVVSTDERWHFFWFQQAVPVGTALDTSLVRPYIEDWLLVQKKNRRLRALEQSIIMNAQQTNMLRREQ